MTTTPAITRHFELPIPKIGDINFAQTLVDWCNQAESTLGCNTNLIMSADVAQGVGTRLSLGFIAGDDAVEGGVDPDLDRWGRVVLQKTMVDGEEVLARLVGITDILGLETDCQFGDTVYHRSNAATLTNDPVEAVRYQNSRLEFLPMGFAYEGGRKVLFNGLLPIQACPSVLGGYPVAYKDGASNPSGTWVESYDATKKATVLTVTFTGASQDIDLIFPFLLPGDFGQFPSLDGDGYFAFLGSFTSTGGGGARVAAIIDSDGVEHSFFTGPESSSEDLPLELSMAQLASIDGAVWEPNTLIYVRVRATGGNTDTVAVRTWALLQYFPFFAWYD